MIGNDRIQRNITKKNLRQKLDMTKSFKSRYRRHIIKRGGAYISKLKFDFEPNGDSGHLIKPEVSLSVVIAWLRSENFNVKSYQQGLYILNGKVLTPASILIFANQLRLKKHLDIFNVG